MAVTASAAVTLAALQARLAGADQWLPIDGDPDATLGDLAGEDSTGPLRQTYGAWRDRLTGCQFTTGRGDLITVGGLAVKNVAGYDLGKLLVGSRGRFGSLVTVTLRTDLCPQNALFLRISEPDTLQHRVNTLLVGDTPPTWMLLASDGLHLGWLGRNDALDRLAPAIESEIGQAPTRRSYDEDIANRADRQALPAASARIDLPPAAVQKAVKKLGTEDFSADPVFGRIWARGIAGDRADDVANEFSGQAVIVDEAGEISLSGDFGDALPILRRLREAFDPTAALPSLPIRR